MNKCTYTFLPISYKGYYGMLFKKSQLYIVQNLPNLLSTYGCVSILMTCNFKLGCNKFSSPLHMQFKDAASLNCT